MKFYGNIDLTDNEMQQMVLATEVNFPDVPKVGRIVFKDKRVYICLEIIAGVPAWVPLTNELDTFIHTQVSASDTWTVSHNLATTTPLVQVYDENYNQFIPDSIEIVDNNEAIITLGTAIAGRAVVMMGSVEGAAKSEFSYEHIQSVTNTVWVIPHGLGYYPIVRVFDGNEELQPQSVVHDSIFQTTVTFSTTRTGTARLV